MQDFLGVIDKHFVPAGLPVFALLESLTNTQRFDQTIMFLEDAVSALALLQNLSKDIFAHWSFTFLFSKDVECLLSA